MIIWILIILQLIDTVLLILLRKSGTFVNVTQKHVYVPAKTKSLSRSGKKIRNQDLDSDYYDDEI